MQGFFAALRMTKRFCSGSGERSSYAEQWWVETARLKFPVGEAERLDSSRGR